MVAVRNGATRTIINDKSWTKYLRKGFVDKLEGVGLATRERIGKELARLCVGAGEGFNCERPSLGAMNLAFQNAENPTGYNYLHGSNIKYGGFTLDSIDAGEVRYDMIEEVRTQKVIVTFTFHDYIDPNATYKSDISKSTAADKICGIVRVCDPKDYEIHLTWQQPVTIFYGPAGDRVVFTTK